MDDLVYIVSYKLVKNKNEDCDLYWVFCMILSRVSKNHAILVWIGFSLSRCSLFLLLVCNLYMMYVDNAYDPKKQYTKK